MSIETTTRTVGSGDDAITYDVHGNPQATTDISAEQHADDLRRLITDAGVGAVDAFGTSGGVVTLLTLLAAAPDLLRRAIVHEPPLAAGLPDRDVVLEVVADMKQTYADEGDGAAMAKFIALVMRDGELPADYLAQPEPDPAMFGMSADDDGARANPLFRNMPALIDYDIDVPVLRALDFPSHHSGFLDQPGYPGDPDAFAARLGEVLARP